LGEHLMNTFVGIIHIIVALSLIILVLIQDSKSNGALGMGGSSSNSLLGATGAQSLASKLTVGAAVIFAITCLTLSVLTSSKTKSVIDTLPAAAAVPSTPGPTTGAPTATTAPATSPAAATPGPATPAEAPVSK
jgi:preprotein translocase subunit SecG